MIYHASMAFVAVVEELKTCTLTRSTYDYSTQASRGRTRKVALDHALRVPLLLALWYEIRVASATLYILDVHRSKESIRLLLSSAAIASDMLATFSSMAAAMAVTWPRPQQHLKKATWTFGGGGGGRNVMISKVHCYGEALGHAMIWAAAFQQKLLYIVVVVYIKNQRRVRRGATCH
jgi:hypothetical protein